MATFSEKLQIGRKSEQAITGLLQQDGYSILVIADMIGDENKAPKLITPQGNYIAPDLLVFKDASYFIEIKYKSNATLYNNWNRLETGLGYRHWMHYQLVQAITGKPILVLFEHDQEGLILGDWIDQLAMHARIYRGDKMSLGGMVFFDFTKLPHHWIRGVDGWARP